LNTQNISIKQLLKPKNTYNKPCFETIYLGGNVKNLLKQKVAQKVTISLGYSISSKHHNELPRVGKNHPIWSPCFSPSTLLMPASAAGLKPST
jgi:hypothetical protein